jgi:putative oxidoreductase
VTPGRVGRLIEATLRLGLGAVFLYAGVVKVPDTLQFALDVQHYELTSWTVSILVAVYLPWLEIFTGLALLARRLYAGALAVAGGLSLMFLAAIGSAWWRGLDITCGCFGKEENATNFPQHIAFNLAMLSAAVVLGWGEPSRKKSAQPLTTPPPA